MSSGTAEFSKEATAVRKKKKGNRKAKRNNTGIICAIILGVFIIMLFAAYFIGRLSYSNKFLKDTFINGTDVGGMTLEQACKELGADTVPETLHITAIDDKDYEIPTSTFNYHSNSREEIKKLYEQVDHNTWFSGLAGRTDYSFEVENTFDKDELDKKLRETKWGTVETKDASLELTDDGYVVYHEVQGNKVSDMDRLVELVEAEVTKGEFDVTLDEDSGVYELPKITSETFDDQCEALNNVFNISITYDFDYTTETLTGKELIDMLYLDDMGNYSVNREKVEEYVQKLADKYDTYNTERKFHATIQGDITVEPSTDALYGWWIYQEPTVDELVGMIEDGVSVEDVKPVYYSEGYFEFTGLPSARSANDDIGKTYIEVDLSNQQLWYYEDGEEMYTCYIVSGQTTSAARTTLEGVYKLWSKETNFRMKASNSDGEQWDSTCNYWNNVSICGIGLHDSTWRGAFGGDIYKWNGSHGCINMPYEGAQYIYNNVELGTPCVMYY